MNLYYKPDYDSHVADTTAKAAWIVESLGSAPVDGVALVRPRSLRADGVALVHDPAYVEAIRTGAPCPLALSPGFWVPSLWPSVTASNGGMIAATLHALQSGEHAGSLSSGMHHARKHHGAGFCTFNGLALAVRAALDAGADGILVLDLDAHFGGGTYALLGPRPRSRVFVVDLSVNALDQYASSVRDDVVALVQEPADYLARLRDALAGFDLTALDVVLYNAGMDPHEACPVGGCPGFTTAVLQARERLVFEWARERRVPVAFGLAGGYVAGEMTQETLVGLHRLTIREAARTTTTGPR